MKENAQWLALFREWSNDVMIFEKMHHDENNQILGDIKAIQRSNAYKV